jgi:hypothetical protein
MNLLREKARREHLYTRELSTVNGLKNDLSFKSKQRQEELT